MHIIGNPVSNVDKSVNCIFPVSIVNNIALSLNNWGNRAVFPTRKPCSLPVFSVRSYVSFMVFTTSLDGTAIHLPSLTASAALSLSFFVIKPLP